MQKASILFPLRFSNDAVGRKRKALFSHVSAGCIVAAMQWHVCRKGIAVTHPFISKSKWNLKIGME